ncbi:MAG TPA: glycerol-3-phosphate 1-O-acyltransferase PlsY [Patescibacteria group bacterium]|nr:glycerol-3-phosphate 1-O-acyltransferase PlsY [Patescibacteria group bacterium]
MTPTSYAAGTLALGLSYLISAIPFGLLVFKLGRGGDIRAQGSGNIGATNVFRAGGKWAGTATLVLDIGKGALSVALVRGITSDPRWTAAAAFASVLGHCFPIYLRFKGGKGIATGCGAYGVLAPLPMGITLGVFLVAMLITRMVSVGSICAGIALPLLILWLQPERPLLVSVGAAAALVILRHQANVRRILAGGEHRISR